MARKCKRFGYRKELQAFGPVKRVRYCKGFRKRRRRAVGWCVTRGKQTVGCHKLKRVAMKRARSLRKRCKARVRVRRKSA
jgi:hypothetical protein